MDYRDHENNGYNSAGYGDNGCGDGYYGEAGEGRPADGYTPYVFTETPVRVKAEPVRREKKHGWVRMLALAMSCSLLGGVVGAAAVRGGSGASGGSTTLVESSRTPTAVNVSYRDTGALMTAAEVYAANVNSTVGIGTSVITTNFWGYRTASAASGSGFIVSSDGYIVTNFHVIENASAITVTCYDGKTWDARFVGGDESMDLAVLKIDAEGLTPVTLGSSAGANVGDDVVAIGNPLGELTFSLTKGSVSALNRAVTLSTDVTMNLIQTDAAINAGNSGGALFNLYGEVIGITNAKYSSSASGEASIDNIGFAIPIDSVKEIIASIIRDGTLVKPYIGVSLSAAEDGVAVRAVEANGPAAEAGLQTGDVITEVNGKAAGSAADVSAAVSAAGVNGTLTLTVSRNGDTLDLTLTVGQTEKAAVTETGGETDAADPQQGNGNGYGSYPFPFGRG